MNGDADSSTGQEGNENAGAETAPTSVNIDEVTDTEQLREILRNPAGFVEGQAPGAEEQGEGAEGEEGSEEGTETEGAEGAEGEGQEGAEGDEEGSGEGKEEGEEESQEEGAQNAKQRTKIRVGHLDDVQRDVLNLVSRKKVSLPEAQELVFEGLVKGGKSVREAEKLVYGQGRGPGARGRVEDGEETAREKTRNAATEEGEESQGDEGAADPIAAQEKEITELEAELLKAEETYDVKEISRITRKLTKAEGNLRDLKAEARTRETSKAQSATERFRAAEAASVAEATALFPDAEKEGTPFFEAIQDAVEDRKESDPDFFKNPNWPKTLAAEVAAELGIPSTKHKAGAKPAQGEKTTKVPAKKPARVITPASGASGGQQQSAVELTADQELEAAGDDPVKIKEVLRKHGSRTLPVGVAA